MVATGSNAGVGAERSGQLGPGLEALIQQGKALEKGEQYDQALVVLEQAVALAPNCEEVTTAYRKAVSHYTKKLARQQQHQKAYEILDHALIVLPNNCILLNSYGNAAARAGDFIKAFKFFEQALKLDDRDVITLNSYAQILIKQGNEEKAAQLFEQSLNLDDRNIITLNSYAQLLMKQGNEERAAQLFEKSLKLDDRNVLTYISYAQLLMKQGNDERAAQLFEQALNLDDCNVITLNSYAQLLMRQGNDERAAQLFEQALNLDDRDVITLNSYAQILMRQGNEERAAQLFEKALNLDNYHVPTLNSYAQFLMRQGNEERAAQLFAQSLNLDDRNIPTLNRYARLLMRQGNEERAAQLFEQSLNFDDRNVITLRNYVQLLIKQGNEIKASQLFERLSSLNGHDVVTLTQYSKVLSKRGDFTQALVVIKQALALDDQDIITLTSYAQLLVKSDYDDQAAQIFQQALELDGENIIALSNYARLLAKSGCNQQAAQLFEKALKLSPSDMITLGRYAQFLIKQGNYQQACNLLDQVVANELVHFSSRDTHAYSSFKHAQTLEAAGRYPQALDRLLKIDLSQQQPYHANIIRLNLGRLYYLLGQAQTGQDYFNTAIYLADDPDQTRLYAARSLLVHRLDLDTAIDLLQSIDEDSPRYANARHTIALNASAQTAYGLFSEPNQSGIDPELLYRAMYHKIGNEVAILKSIAQRLLRKIQGEHPLVAEIVANLDTMQASIIQERSSQQAAIEQLSSPNYTKTLQIIAETAHNVSDWVNNELAVIESKTRRALRKLDSKSPHADHFNRLLYQLELTQAALSDLKSISEGMPIQHRRFPVCRLFEKWQPEHWSSTPRIQKARVRLFIDNPDSEFDGDEEKIKSILNELVENSLKHNANHRDLLIRIYSRDLLNPTDIAAPTIPGDRRYLYLQFIDNGQGIPQDKKDWIFQPLHTTSSDEKGSGLGLFIIRKTIQQMGGFIQEVGEPDQGVRFQIYLPYPSDSDIP